MRKLNTYRVGDRLHDLRLNETDEPIGTGTEGPRSRLTTGSIRFKVGFTAPQNKSIKVIILS